MTRDELYDALRVLSPNADLTVTELPSGRIHVGIGGCYSLTITDPRGRPIVPANIIASAERMCP